ncbi:helix-turn-helix transcriptional regulator [Streptomyces sp. NPDC014776]|uniref:helix-turn-helix transcriptional regulator n=1 Tax=unclassified Streptomyces TaxID=2593676 RepID=UPI0036F937DC
MAGIPQLAFPHRPGSLPGVQVVDLPELLERAARPADGRFDPVRPAFHLLFTVHAGHLVCAVDDTECLVTSGSWLWVRPGQVLQLGAGSPEIQGTAVLFMAHALGADAVTAIGLDQRAWRLPVTLTADADASVRQTLAMLTDEYRQLGLLPLEAHAEVVRHLLAVLLLRLTHLPATPRAPAAGSEAFHRFHQAVEDHFTRTHRVEDYAARLGYSVRNLSRVTQAAVGLGAKRIIDDRVLLEARRMLLHTDLPAASIAERLGFPSATAFARFFRRRTGETPTGFRARPRRAQPSPPPSGRGRPSGAPTT